MTPKPHILDAGDTLLLCNIDKLWYIHCDEHNNITIPLPPYDCTVIKRFLICDSHQGGNEFLHDSLASCPSADRVDRNVYLTINMAFAHQQQLKFP